MAAVLDPSVFHRRLSLRESSAVTRYFRGAKGDDCGAKGDDCKTKGDDCKMKGDYRQSAWQSLQDCEIPFAAAAVAGKSPPLTPSIASIAADFIAMPRAR